MQPLDLLSSTEFWTPLFVALVGGGGVGAIIGAISSRRKDTADIAAKACDILTHSVIKPLREQVDEQAGQIEHLEKTAAQVLRAHGVHPFAFPLAAGVLRGRRSRLSWSRHPKPHLPDELRADIAPETFSR